MNQIKNITYSRICYLLVFILFANNATAKKKTSRLKKVTTVNENKVLADRDSNAHIFGDKIALLIGNADYKGEKALRTPINDVAKIEGALKKLNFYVVRIDNATRDEIQQALLEFRADSKFARVAFFYYSGHMVQFNEKNFLVPVDAKLRKEKYAVAQTVALDSIIHTLKASENVISIDVGQPINSKSNKSILSNRDYFSAPNNLKDTFISFTKGNHLDVKKGESSLFSTFFSKEIIKKGLPYDAFLATRSNIQAITQGEQDLAAFGYITNCNTGYGSCDNWENNAVISFMPIVSFPWPPPSASAKDVIPMRFFLKCKTLGDVDKVLKSAFDKTEYFEKSYFPINNFEQGFVVATRLEQINDDATSLKGTNRWAVKNNERFKTVSGYLKSLFMPQKGYFRVIVFAVTNASLKPSGENPTRDEAMGWLKGDPFLGSVENDRLFTEDYTVTALIYEYQLPENDVEATLVPRSLHQGREHLIKSNLWSELNKN